ncbi:hypothetical protein GCM10023185_29690 [Hymenobacter saemangeumensis]|uniref:Chromosome segregation ATPase n=1 Tax=Hymenobacter saemangeumensis TaxID=1084522 RepID=A0ABP8IL37_9BACT
MADETVILKVTLDEGKTEQQLQKLVLDIEATRKKQQELNAARKAGTVEDAEYAKRSVELQAQLKTQRQEQTTLTKNLELYRTASGELGNTYKGMQAQLSLAQRQFQALDGSADNSSEAAQELTKTIDGLRNTLKSTDAQQSLFVRNVGNYNGAIEPLIQQLVKLQEQQKKTAEGTEEHVNVARQIGFVQQAAAQAGAKAGMTYEETQAKLKGYSDTIRPAVANLVQLEEEQQKVAEGSEAFNQIGFKIAQAKKAIEETPAEIKSVGEAIEEIDSTTNVFGGHIGDLKQRFAQAKQGVELAKGSFTGLKGAIAGTGIGVLILALGALFEYFTKTDEGAEDLAAGLAFLKGLFAPLGAVASGAGKALVGVFKDPKQAASDLIDFIEDQVINRIKAIGVIWEGLKNGDFKQATNGVLQYATGVEDVIGKTQALAAESKRAASAAYEISRAKDALDDAERDEIVRNEENKNLIDQLVLSAKDRSLTEQQRLANLDRAGRLETETLQRTITLAKERLRIQQLENAEAERTGRISDEQRTALAEAEAAVVKLAGESATQQQAIQNRRAALLEQEAARDKAAADRAKAAAEKEAERRLQMRRDALALQGVLLDRELQQVQAGSDRELSILQQKLRVGYQAELNVKNLTVGAKKVIDARYENESLALMLDFNRKRLLAALQTEVDLTAAQLSQQQQGSDEALRLQQQQIENQRRLAIAGLAENADNTAKIAAINAQAANQQRQAEFTEAVRLLNVYLDEKRRAVERDHALGLLSENEYQRKLNAINKAGVEAQAVVNADYQQNNAENAKRGADVEVREAQRVAAEKKRAREAEQQIDAVRLAAAQQFTETAISLLGEESDAGKSFVALKKALALVEIGLNLQRELSANAVAAATIGASAGPAGPALQAAYLAGANALSIANAALAAANILQLRRGGIADGPSHEQGGIPLLRQGYHTGIEIEGGEAIINRNSTKLFLPLLSQINQAGGGRALTGASALSTHLALGGVTTALIRQSLNGSSAPGNSQEVITAAVSASAKEIGAEVAHALRKNPPITRITDVQSAQQRSSFTTAETDA